MSLFLHDIITACNNFQILPVPIPFILSDCIAEAICHCYKRHNEGQGMNVGYDIVYFLIGAFTIGCLGLELQSGNSLFGRLLTTVSMAFESDEIASSAVVMSIISSLPT